MNKIDVAKKVTLAVAGVLAVGTIAIAWYRCANGLCYYRP